MVILYINSYLLLLLEYLIKYCNMKVVDHKIHNDNRGSYTPIPLDLLDEEWSQCSISTNDSRYTFRGLHYQTNPSQIKYVKVIRGAIVDIGYDLKTKETHSEILTEGNAVYLHDGYAHGFLTLEPDTIVVYLVSGVYSPESEHSIVWSTIPKVKKIIEEYTDKPIISEKDNNGK